MGIKCRVLQAQAVRRNLQQRTQYFLLALGLLLFWSQVSGCPSLSALQLKSAGAASFAVCLHRTGTLGVGAGAGFVCSVCKSSRDSSGTTGFLH